VDELTRVGKHPILRFHRPSLTGHRASHRIYISAGIHGDEPAGPLAVLRLLMEDRWPENAEIDLFPCLNPEGMAESRREGPDGVDLNRDYREPETSLVQAHLKWFADQPQFSLGVMLHEDWEADGFYLYELMRDGGSPMAEDIIAQVKAVCPILQASHADDWPATNGVVRPNVDPMERPEWPEAVYVFMEKTNHCCTFEAPSDYPLQTRVNALVTAVNRALRNLVETSS
jgi:hypothetical protein